MSVKLGQNCQKAP